MTVTAATAAVISAFLPRVDTKVFFSPITGIRTDDGKAALVGALIGLLLIPILRCLSVVVDIVARAGGDYR